MTDPTQPVFSDPPPDPLAPQPPSGPPPGPGANVASGDGGDGGSRQNMARIAAIAVVIVLVVGALIVFTSGGSDEDDAGGDEDGAGEIFLEPAAVAGPDPFGESSAAPTPSSTVPLGTQVTLGTSGATTPDLGPVSGGSGGARSYAGNAPGLYGGTKDKASCNVEQMASFLEQNPAKARAWASAQGIDAADVASYVRGLTPVILRADTRVTNYGYSAERATPRQSVLEAGTAVLVDEFGEPQAKCNCGNPLDPPKPASSTPTYTGPEWAGFSPGNVTVIQPSATAITIITVVDITTGTPYGKPTGPNPPPDTTLPSPTTPTKPTTPTTQTRPTTPATTVPPPAVTTTPPNQGTIPPGVPRPGPGIAGPGAEGCAAQIKGTYLERVEIKSETSATVQADQPNAPGCYALVFSGNVDMDTTDSFEGGFDPTWCFDPKYCDPPNSSVKLMNGQTFWAAYGLTAGPPYSDDHVYTFYVREASAGGFVFGLTDTAHDDNSGSWFVDIYA